MRILPEASVRLVARLCRVLGQLGRLSEVAVERPLLLAAPRTAALAARLVSRTRPTASSPFSALRVAVTESCTSLLPSFARRI